MTRTFIAALALLALSGCGGETDGGSQPDPTVVTTSASGEDQFVEQVRGLGDGLFDPVSDTQLLDIGNGVCAVSRTSTSEAEYVDTFFTVIAGSTDITPELTVAYAAEAGYALRYLCPDQAERWGN